MADSYTTLLRTWVSKHYRQDVLETSTSPTREGRGQYYKASVSVVGMSPHHATDMSEWLALNKASRSLFSFLVTARKEAPESALSRQSLNYLAIAEPGIDVAESDFEHWEKILDKQFAGEEGWVVVASRTYDKYMGVGVYWEGHQMADFSGLDDESITYVFDYLPANFFVRPKEAEKLLHCDSEQPWLDPDKTLDDLDTYVTPAGKLTGPLRMGRYVSHLRRLSTKRRIFPADLATDLTWSPNLMTPHERMLASSSARRQDTCLQIMYAHRSSVSPEIIVAHACGSGLLVDDLLRMHIAVKHISFQSRDLEGIGEIDGVLIRNCQEAAKYVQDHDGAIFCYKLECTRVTILTLASMFAQRDCVVRTY